MSRACACQSRRSSSPCRERFSGGWRTPPNGTYGTHESHTSHWCEPAYETLQCQFREPALIPRRAAVFARFRAAVQHAGARVDPNGLVAAAVTDLFDDLMATPLQLAQHRGGDAAFRLDRAALTRAGFARGRGRADVLDAAALRRPACTSMPKSIRFTSTCTWPCGCMSPPMTPKTNHGLSVLRHQCRG